MAQNRIVRSGPTLLTTTAATAMLSTGSGARAVAPVGGFGDLQQYIILRHIRAVNVTGVAANISLAIGATGVVANTGAVVWFTTSVAANSFLEWFGMLRLDSGTNEFLNGQAGTANAIALDFEFELGVAG